MDEKVDKQSILEKLWSLSPDRLAEVEDFVDFLLYRQAAGQLATAASSYESGTTLPTPIMTGYEFGGLVLAPFPNHGSVSRQTAEPCGAGRNVVPSPHDAARPEARQKACLLAARGGGSSGADHYRRDRVGRHRHPGSATFPDRRARSPRYPR